MKTYILTNDDLLELLELQKKVNSNYEMTANAVDDSGNTIYTESYKEFYERKFYDKLNSLKQYEDPKITIHKKKDKDRKVAKIEIWS